MDWEPVQKPAEIAEKRLLEAILSSHFPINSNLPGERELAVQIGVTRPTLRETLQRLARDGWLDIQHGKPTRIRDFWREGNLAVLSILAQFPTKLPPDFIVHLLELRVLLAPAYAQQALSAAPHEITSLLENYTDLEDNPAVYAKADWELHTQLTQWSTNPVFRLLLNGFQKLYILMGEHYFAFPQCRRHSQNFYQALHKCARRGADRAGGLLTRRVMEESLALWQKMQEENI